MSNVFQNAYRRIRSPGSMTHECACKPTSAVHDEGDLPGLSRYRSCRCFSGRPLLEAVNCFLEKPACFLCGFLGFPKTSPDGNDLTHPRIWNKSQCHPMIPIPRDREWSSKADFQDLQSIPSWGLPSDGKNVTSAVVIIHCPFKYHWLPTVFDCVLL